MNNIDKYFDAYEKLMDYVDNNIFQTNTYCKIDKKIKISAVFPIYLRNPSEFELEYLKDNCMKRILSFFKIFSSLSEFIKIDIFDIPDKYIYFREDIFKFKNIYDMYIKENDNKYIEKAIVENNINAFAAYLCSYINEELVLIEIEDYNLIDKILMKYFICSKKALEDMDYKYNFIEGFVNLFNIVNFDLRIIKGINIKSKYEISNCSRFNKLYNDSVLKMIKQPIYVDSFIQNDNDYMNIIYLIFNLVNYDYMIDRKKSISLITCLEFLVVQKFKNKNIYSKLFDCTDLQKQFALKIKKCCSLFDYKINREELINLYDYRSCIIHGNFDKLSHSIDKIMNYNWYSFYMRKVYDNCNVKSPDNDEKENYIYSRLYELFNLVYRLFCEYPSYINMLKNYSCKEKINNFNLPKDYKISEMRFL